MKTLLIVMMVLLTACSPTLRQSMLGAEIGTGVKVVAYRDNSYTQDAFLLRVPISKYTFIESRIGTLAEGNVYSVAGGLESKGKLRFNVSLGGAYVTDPPYDLTGHEQFIVSTGVTYSVTDDLDLFVTARHLSNGAYVLGHDRKPNLGLDGLFIGFGFRF